MSNYVPISRINIACFPVYLLVLTTLSRNDDSDRVLFNPVISLLTQEHSIMMKHVSTNPMELVSNHRKISKSFICIYCKTESKCCRLYMSSCCCSPQQLNIFKLITNGFVFMLCRPIPRTNYLLHLFSIFYFASLQCL